MGIFKGTVHSDSMEETRELILNHHRVLFFNNLDDNNEEDIKRGFRCEIVYLLPSSLNSDSFFGEEYNRDYASGHFLRITPIEIRKNNNGREFTVPLNHEKNVNIKLSDKQENLHENLSTEKFSTLINSLNT